VSCSRATGKGMTIPRIHLVQEGETLAECKTDPKEPLNDM
jgi:hypothetical protein